MNRKIRFAPGEYYHVYNRGVEKRDIFTNDEDRRRFQNLLYLCNSEKSIIYRLVQGSTLYQEVLGKKLVAVGAYVLMPNHFHVLLKEVREGGITEYLRKLTTAYTMYFNKKYSRVGPLFQGTFKAQHADHDEYLKYLYAYIHLNPVKTIDSGWDEKRIRDQGKAKAFLKGFPYSSYIDLAGGKRRPEASVLSLKEFPEYFEDGAEFEALLRDWMSFEGEETKKEKGGGKTKDILDESAEGENLMAEFLDQ